MNLSDYLNSANALSASELAKAIKVDHVAQVNQWRNPKSKRKPNPANCMAIERATGGAVCRWDLRPADWYEIWPDLVGTEGAPAVPAEAASN